MFSELDRAFMQEAIELAKEAELNDEVPVGAVITLDNKIIGRGFNQVISCLLYTSPSPRDRQKSRMPSSA